jgi:hypothetical protein
LLCPIGNIAVLKLVKYSQLWTGKAFKSKTVPHRIDNRYSLLHQFIVQVIEADELYPKVAKNTAAWASEGWTIVLMERGSRFLWELNCGPQDDFLELAKVCRSGRPNLNVSTNAENLMHLVEREIRHAAGRHRDRFPIGLQYHRHIE